MMFKEKSFGAAPPFLQLDDSESDAEKDDRNDGGDNSIMEKIKTEINADNSIENSMHAASEAASNDSAAMLSHLGNNLKIKNEKKKCIEDGASDISSDDEVLESCTPPKPMAGDVKLDDDKMSLSSLSSTEEKSNRKSTIGDANIHKNIVPQMTDYYYPHGANPYYYPNGENAVYDPYSNQYMPPHGYIQPYTMPGFPALIPGGYVQSNEYPEKRPDPITPAQPKKDPSEQIVAAVIERVKTELKQILKKDFNKRMIESIAYKKYDSWWDEQAQNKNKPPVIV